MISSTLKHSRRFIPAVVIGLAFVYLLHFTWLRWGDLLIDLGRELYVPERLASGDVLYRDIFYLYGPFSPYFNALLYKIFGTYLLTLAAGGIVVTGLVSALLYKLARAFMDTFLSTFTVIVFLFVLAFGHYVAIGNYNFILPYSYPATHGVLFALAAFFFLFRDIDRPSKRDAAGAGVCLFLCLITRLEIGMMLLVVMSVAVSTWRGSRGKLSWAGLSLLLPLIAALLVYGVFFIVAGTRVQESNLFDLFKSNAQGGNLFVLQLSGADAWQENSWLMLKSFFFLKSFFSFELQYRIVPLICLIAGAISFVRYFRGGRSALDLKLALLSLFALLMLGRVFWQVHAWHYGFYLLVPGLVVYHAFLFHTVPSLVNNKAVTRTLYGGFTLVLCVLMADHFAVTRQMYAQRTFSLTTSVGQITAVDNDRTRGVDALVHFMREQTPRDATLAVFPEGVMINYLSGRKSPLYDYSFLPQDLYRADVEGRIVEEIKTKKPDYVIMVQRPVEEYGRRGFGVDYGLKIAAEIQADYKAVAQYGPVPFTARTFTAVIFKRVY